MAGSSDSENDIMEDQGWGARGEGVQQVEFVTVQGVLNQRSISYAKSSGHQFALLLIYILLLTLQLISESPCVLPSGDNME